MCEFVSGRVERNVLERERRERGGKEKIRKGEWGRTQGTWTEGAIIRTTTDRVTAELDA